MFVEERIEALMSLTPAELDDVVRAKPRRHLPVVLNRTEVREVLMQLHGTHALMATLLYELERTGGRYGLQTMCESGGLANATIIEVL